MTKSGLLGIAATAFLAGCTSSARPSDGALIRCANDSECPGALFCNEATRLCEEPGIDATEFPALQVAFVNPVDGASAIPVNTTIVLAFSANVDASKIDAAVRLRRVGGEDVPLSRIEGELSNTFQFALEQDVRLQETTAYEIIVEAGLEAPLGAPVRPMESAFSSTFTTGIAPDETAPAPVTDLVLTRYDDIVELSWTPPSDDDFSGVLIVRAQGEPVSGTPQAQVAYDQGAPLENGSGVALVRTTVVPSPAAPFEDPVSPGFRYDYVLYAYDAANNYSAPTRAPFSLGEELLWCPDRSSAFDATLPVGQGATQRLAITNHTGPNPPTAIDEYSLATPETPVGSRPSIPLDTSMLLGERYWVRHRLESGGQVRFTAPRFFEVADPDLGPGSIVGTAVGAEWTLDLGAWTWLDATLEGELNTTPGLPSSGWGSAGISLDSSEEPLVKLVMNYEGPDIFRARARPVVDGCPSGAWTESAPQSLGDVAFVDPGVSGGDGTTPQTAFQSVSQALAAATAGQLIRVRGFPADDAGAPIYQESLSLPSNVQLVGGYNADFTTRGLQSRIACDSSPTLTVSSGVTEAALVEGFSLECDSHPAVVVTDGAPILYDNILRGGGATTTGFGTGPVAVHVIGADASPRLRSNTIEVEDGSGSPAALVVENGATIDARDNSIRVLENPSPTSTASAAVYLDGVSGEMNGNSVYGGSSAGFSYGMRLVLADSRTVALANNVIAGGSGVTGSAGVTVTGLNGAAKITNNTISSGASSVASNPAVATQSLEATLLINNIFFDVSNAFNSVGIRAPDYPSFGGVLLNNTFVDIETLMDLTAGSTPVTIELDAFGAFCSRDSGMPDFCMPLNEGGGSDAGNDQLATFADAGFQSPDTPVLSSTSPAQLVREGVDSNASNRCNVNDNSSDGSCGDLSVDRIGTPRTCPTPGGTSPDCFSRGAYERD